MKLTNDPEQTCPLCGCDMDVYDTNLGNLYACCNCMFVVSVKDFERVANALKIRPAIAE